MRDTLKGIKSTIESGNTDGPQFKDWQNYRIPKVINGYTSFTSV